MLMIDVNRDSESLAEKYDKISKYQYINGMALVEKLIFQLDIRCWTWTVERGVSH
jgi:hypothetical protein